MSTVNLYNWQAETIGTVELPDAVFGVKMNPRLVKQAVVTQEANRRVAIAKTKTRGEVRGGGRKPWKQKGTGRARQGSIRAPQWRGGGVIFGPTNARNFEKKINTKAKRAALRMVLTDKAQQDRLIVVDQFMIETRKTKTVDQALRRFSLLSKKPFTLMILPEKMDVARQATANLNWVDTVLATSLNVRDLVRASYCVISKQGIEQIAKVYGHRQDALTSHA